jgi:hypothetical protein
MLADFATDDAGLFDALDDSVKIRLRTDSNRIARGTAGRSLGLNARQVQADNIIAGLDVGMPRRAIGIFALRQKCQANDFQVEFLRTRQVAHRKGYMV